MLNDLQEHCTAKQLSPKTCAFEACTWLPRQLLRHALSPQAWQSSACCPRGRCNMGTAHLVNDKLKQLSHLSIVCTRLTFQTCEEHFLVLSV